MSGLELTYLSGADVEAIRLTDDEILGAIESVLAAQGRGESVLGHAPTCSPTVRRGTSTCCAVRSPSREPVR